MIINNLEWSKIKKWNKTFEEIEIPKGWRLPTTDELKSIYKTDKVEEFDEEYKKVWHWIYCQQAEYAKENNLLSGVFLGSNGGFYASNEDLSYAYDGGRVVFCREINKLMEIKIKEKIKKELDIWKVAYPKEAKVLEKFANKLIFESNFLEEGDKK